MALVLILFVLFNLILTSSANELNHSFAPNLSLKVNGFETKNGSLFPYDIGQHLVVECSSTVIWSKNRPPWTTLSLYKNVVLLKQVTDTEIIQEKKSTQFIKSYIIKGSFTGWSNNGGTRLRCSLEVYQNERNSGITRYNIERYSYVTLSMNKPTEKTDISLKINGKELGNGTTYEYYYNGQVNVRCSSIVNIMSDISRVTVSLYSIKNGFEVSHGFQSKHYYPDYTTFYIDVLYPINDFDDGINLFCKVHHKSLNQSKSHDVRFVKLKRIIPVVSTPEQETTKKPEDGQFYSNVTTSSEILNTETTWFKAVLSLVVIVIAFMILLCIFRVWKKKNKIRVDYNNLQGVESKSKTTAAVEETCTNLTDNTEAIYANTQPYPKSLEELYSQPIPKDQRNGTKEVQYATLDFEHNKTDVVYKNVNSREQMIAKKRQNSEPMYTEIQQAEPS